MILNLLPRSYTDGLDDADLHDKSPTGARRLQTDPMGKGHLEGLHS
jgi:hypothetical protein